MEEEELNDDLSIESEEASEINTWRLGDENQDEEYVDLSALTIENNRRVLMNYLFTEGFRPYLDEDEVQPLRFKMEHYRIDTHIEDDYLALKLCRFDWDWFSNSEEITGAIAHINSTRKLISAYNFGGFVEIKISHIFKTHESMLELMDLKLEWLVAAVRELYSQYNKLVEEKTSKAAESESDEESSFDAENENNLDHETVDHTDDIS